MLKKDQLMNACEVKKETWRKGGETFDVYVFTSPRGDQYIVRDQGRASDLDTFLAKKVDGWLIRQLPLHELSGDTVVPIEEPEPTPKPFDPVSLKKALVSKLKEKVIMK